MARTGVPGVLLVFLMGCAGAAAPRRVAPPPPAPAAKLVTAEQRTANDRQYFLAVSAYTKGEFDESMAIVKEILAVDPANRDALTLRDRILAAKKAGAP